MKGGGGIDVGGAEGGRRWLPLAAAAYRHHPSIIHQPPSKLTNPFTHITIAHTWVDGWMGGWRDVLASQTLTHVDGWVGAWHSIRPIELLLTSRNVHTHTHTWVDGWMDEWHALTSQPQTHTHTWMGGWVGGTAAAAGAGGGKRAPKQRLMIIKMVLQNFKVSFLLACVWCVWCVWCVV
jgi:hypothetical protein